MRIAKYLLQSGTNTAFGMEAIVVIKDLLVKHLDKQFGFCWQCQWFYLQKPNRDPDKRSGQCKVNPPVVMVAPDTKGVMKLQQGKFPGVKGGNWCGTFMLRIADMRGINKAPRKPLMGSSETAVEGGLK